MSKIDFTLNEQTVQIERDSFHYIWNYFFIFTNSTEISVGFLIFSFFFVARIIDLISTLISFVFTLQNSVRNVVKFYSRIQFEMKIRLMQCTYKPFAAEHIHRLNSNIFYDYPLCGCNHIFLIFWSKWRDKTALFPLQWFSTVTCDRWRRSVCAPCARGTNEYEVDCTCSVSVPFSCAEFENKAGKCCVEKAFNNIKAEMRCCHISFFQMHTRMKSNEQVVSHISIINRFSPSKED